MLPSNAFQILWTYLDLSVDLPLEWTHVSIWIRFASVELLPIQYISLSRRDCIYRLNSRLLISSAVFRCSKQYIVFRRHCRLQVNVSGYKLLKLDVFQLHQSGYSSFQFLLFYFQLIRFNLQWLSQLVTVSTRKSASYIFWLHRSWWTQHRWSSRFNFANQRLLVLKMISCLYICILFKSKLSYDLKNTCSFSVIASRSCRHSWKGEMASARESWKILSNPIWIFE